MALPRQVTEEDVIIYRVQARALAKRLERSVEAGTLLCEACGNTLSLDEAQVWLLECGHEVIIVPCTTEGCALHDGRPFSPAGWPDHGAADRGVALPFATWRRL
jgi:hypothetical protein